MTYPSPKRNMVPKAILMKSGQVSLTTARSVNTAQPRTTINSARPMTMLLIKHIQLPKAVVNTARPKAVLNAVKGNQVNAVKASACWGNPQQDLQEKGVIDSGYSRHMTGNMSYVTDFEEINRGYVAFGGNPKGGKQAEVQKHVIISKSSPDAGFKSLGDDEKKVTEEPGKEGGDPSK
ncbi:hypothetical protein Tco_0029827 [Tanacetum coccineum]